MEKYNTFFETNVFRYAIFIRYIIYQKISLLLSSNSTNMMLYKINFVFAIILFILTVTYRNEAVYALVSNVQYAKLFLNIWNWIMLVSLLFSSIQSLFFVSRYGSVYYLLSVLAIVLLLFTAFGMFIMPRGTI